MEEEVKRAIPAVVAHALDAVKRLRAEDPDKASEVAQVLPAYALKNKDMSADELLSAARLGVEFLKAARPVPVQERTYQDIVYKINGAMHIRVRQNRAGKLQVSEEFREKHRQNHAELSSLKNIWLYRLAKAGDMEGVGMMIDAYGANPRANNSECILAAVSMQNYEVAEFLLKKGASMPVLSKERKATWQEYNEKVSVWKKLHRGLIPPRELLHKSPYFFYPKAFAVAQGALYSEGYEAAHAAHMAYDVSALFGTPDRMLRYLEKWGKRGAQPFHDIVHMISFSEGSLGKVNLKDWGDAILQHGPEMAEFLKFADRMPSPMKNAGGTSWSLTKTAEKAGEFLYARGRENPRLAALCRSLKVYEPTFNKALGILKQPVPPKNIPSISIDGEEFGMVGSRFYQLPANDMRGLFLGRLTDCCQSIDGAGQQCAVHGFSSPNGGFYVVENAKGRVIGQTWAWRGERDEMVFDTLETLGDNVAPEQWRKILEICGQKISEMKTDITRLTVGLGGDTPIDYLEQAFAKATAPAKPKDYNGYWEAKTQLEIWRRKP